jgi:hypothetical protein
VNECSRSDPLGVLVSLFKQETDFDMQATGCCSSHANIMRSVRVGNVSTGKTNSPNLFLTQPWGGALVQACSQFNIALQKVRTV